VNRKCDWTNVWMGGSAKYGVASRSNALVWLVGEQSYHDSKQAEERKQTKERTYDIHDWLVYDVFA